MAHKKNSHTHISSLVSEYISTFISLYYFWLSKWALNEVKVSVCCSTLNIPAWCAPSWPSASAPLVSLSSICPVKSRAHVPPLLWFLWRRFPPAQAFGGWPSSGRRWNNIVARQSYTNLIYISKHEPWTVAYSVCSLNSSQLVTEPPLETGQTQILDIRLL